MIFRENITDDDKSDKYSCNFQNDIFRSQRIVVIRRKAIKRIRSCSTLDENIHVAGVRIVWDDINIFGVTDPSKLTTISSSRPEYRHLSRNLSKNILQLRFYYDI